MPTKVASSVTLDQFEAYVVARPPRLRCWTHDRDVMYPLLAWLNVWPVIDQRRLLAADREVLALLAMRGQHNQLAMAVKWAYRYLGRRRPSLRPRTEGERHALFDLAGDHVGIENLLAEARIGARRYEADGTTLRFRYAADARVDSLDRMLGVVNDVRSIPSPEEAARRWSPEFRSWLDSGGWNVPWSTMPLEARAEYRHEAERAITSSPRYLSGDLDLGSFTPSDAEAVLGELLARAMHSHVATIRGCVNLLAVIPPYSRPDLVREFTEATGRPAGPIEAVVDLLTYDPERSDDPCLAPVLPVGEMLVPMSSLIVPSSLPRNLTALLQRDPRTFGAAGRQLGALGIAKMTETLRRLAAAEIATGIKVTRANGSQAGDLDVVTYDPRQQLMAVFEVMWRIGPDGSKEIAQMEAIAKKKRAQVVRLRDEIVRGVALPQWPESWAQAREARIRWFVVTPDLLPLEAVADGVTIRSHRMLAYTLKRDASVADLVQLMDDPPYPPDALAQTSWRRLRYGKYAVEFDVLPP